MIFRKASFADADLLLSWRNDPQTIENSLSPGAVARENHLVWLQKILSGTMTRLFIAYQEKDESPVGTVRLDAQELGWELSWTVAPSFRGKGIGQEMVSGAANLENGKIFARIKSANKASMKIAKNCGFQMVREESGVTYWELAR